MARSICLLKPGLCLQHACASRRTGACMSVRCKCLKMVEIVEVLCETACDECACAHGCMHACASVLCLSFTRIINVAVTAS